MVGALCFVLRGSPKSSGSSDGYGAATTVVQIVSTRAKDSSSLDAPRCKVAAASAPMTTGGRTAGLPLPAASPQSAELRILRDQRSQSDASPV